MRSCYEIYTFTKQVIIMNSFSIDYCDIIPITSTIFQYFSKCVKGYCAYEITQRLNVQNK